MSAFQAAFEALRKTVGDVEADRLLTAVENEKLRKTADDFEAACPDGAGPVKFPLCQCMAASEMRLMADASPTAAPVPDETAGDVTELERLRARVAELEKDSARLNALYAAGVDSWDGYDIALEGVES